MAAAGTANLAPWLALLYSERIPVRNTPAFSAHFVATKPGLPTIRFHDLRHTFATLMFSNGEHPKIVQEILGHAQITLTLDTYSHVLPSMQDGAVGRLGDLLD